MYIIFLILRYIIVEYHINIVNVNPSCGNICCNQNFNRAVAEFLHDLITLCLLEVAVQRAVNELGISPVDAVEAATLAPARAFGYDKPNAVTGAPLGLLAPGYAADLLLTDPSSWTVNQVWCAGRKLK